jgi:hypothetical protein
MGESAVKKWLIFMALLVALPISASAATYTFNYDFDGTDAVLAGGDTPNGTVLNVGDSYTVNLNAQSGFAWSVLSSHTSSLDMSYLVGPNDPRTTALDLDFLFGGSVVGNFVNPSQNQSQAHIGAQGVLYTAGTVFDQISFTLTLLSASGPTTIGSNDLGIFGTAFWDDQRIAYGAVSPVPLPAGLSLLLVALGSLAVIRRRIL